MPHQKLLTRKSSRRAGQSPQTLRLELGRRNFQVNGFLLLNTKNWSTTASGSTAHLLGTMTPQLFSRLVGFDPMRPTTRGKHMTLAFRGKRDKSTPMHHPGSFPGSRNLPGQTSRIGRKPECCRRIRLLIFWGTTRVASRDDPTDDFDQLDPNLVHHVFRIWSAWTCHRFQSLGIRMLRVRIWRAAHETVGRGRR